MRGILLERKPRVLEGDEELLKVMFIANKLGHPSIAEIYSPPRVTALAEQYGIQPGVALDLTVLDPLDNQPWDFDVPAKRQREKELLKFEKPDLLIGSPMCGAFAALLNLSRAKMGEGRWKITLEHGRTRFGFMCELYKIQHDAGILFWHEHPASASSWRELCIMKISELDNVEAVVGHMCQFQMIIKDQEGVGLVEELTRFMTNSKHVAKSLHRLCKGPHRHVHLVNGRAQAAEAYPRTLRVAILKGLYKHMLENGRLTMDNNVQHVAHDEDLIANVEECWDEFVDDGSGLPFESGAVREARAVEMRVFTSFPVYTKVPTSEARRVIGRGPIGVCWLDTNKGDEEKLEYRSRLVAKEIAHSKDDAMFAATPPLEAKKAFLSLATTGTKGSSNPLPLLFVDDRREYLYAKSRRPVSYNFQTRTGKMECVAG